MNIFDSNAVKDIVHLKHDYRHYWRDKDNNYWLQRLMQEVGELASVLANDHDDTLEHELKQISAIAMNWLEKLYDESGRH